MTTIPLVRRLAAEAVGTAVLAAVVVGSGLRAGAPSADDGGRLLAVALPSTAALAVLIALFGPVSGGHFNPLVSAGAWWTARGTGGGPTAREAAGYGLAQLVGAVTGVASANLLFDHPVVGWSAQQRSGITLWLGEAAATGVLLLVVFGLLRCGRERYLPVAVAGWVCVAGWASPSSGFVNPALTLGRVLVDGGPGIAAGSVPGFVLAQCAGAATGLALVAVVFGAATGRPAEEPAVAPEQVAGRVG